MRLLHFADLHLGQELYGFDRGPEHAAFLDWLLALIAAEPVDAILLAGDVFHSVNPPTTALRAWYRFLRRVAVAAPGAQLVVIAGNHDSAQRLELPLELIGEAGLHVIGVMPRRDGRPAPARTLIPLTARGGGAPRAVVAAIPYLRPGDAPSGPEPVAALYAEAAEAARRDWPGLPLVMMGHLHVAGGAVSELSERRILVGGEEAVSADSFPPEAAYVALGHLHRPQTLSRRPLARYAGAPFPLSATERDYDHGVSIVTLTGGAAEVEHRSAPRPVAFIRAPERGALPLAELEALLRALKPPPSPCGPAFLEAAVALDSAEPDLRARIEAALGDAPVRLGRIIRHTAHSEGAENPAAAEALVDLSPETVFAEIHAQKYGAPPPQRLAEAFRDLLVEAAHTDTAP